MIRNIKSLIFNVINKIKLSKINYLNHRLKKYIIKYEETNDNIKIFNSNGDNKIVANTIANKVKLMEIIKEHEKEIDNKIEYYISNRDDNMIIILFNSLLLVVLGCVFIFSFFVGSYIFLLLALISFSISLLLFSASTFKILLNREEVKRLKLLRENKDILNDSELIDLIKDILVIVKNRIYSIIIKVFDLFENKKVNS